MGQRNMQYSSNITNLETDQRGPEYLHPQPCVFYGSIPNFPQPNLHPVLPAPSNMFHHPSEHHDNSLFFGMPQHTGTGFHRQHAASSVERPHLPSSIQYSPYMAPPSAPRDFHGPVNHGSHDQAPFSSMGRSLHYMDDGQGSSKRKNFEASSSSVAPMGTAWPVEPDVTMMDANDFAPPDSSVMNHNHNYLVQGSYASQPFPLPGNPWLGRQPLSNNSGDNDALAWNTPPALPYPHGDSGITNVQGYQVTNNSRSSAGFVPPFFQRHPTVHHPLPPMQGVRGGPSISFPSQVTSSRSGLMNTLHGVVEVGPRYMGPVPQTGFRIYRPQRREDTYDMNIRHQNLPHLRILPEDGVAMLEVPAYHELIDSADQHRDMRLDIDHMSYEELLALGEQIGSVTTGISEEDVTRHLKTRSFPSSSTVNDRDEEPSAKDFDFCVVCQDRELVGTLDCGHEYHVDCIKKWLLMKNTCPVCKCTALNPKRKNL